MRVLFLDFDGVLNSSEFVERTGWVPPLGSDGDLAILDPRAVGLLRDIVEATGAAVVVSSSWRLAYSLDGLRSLLERSGFRGRIIGVTPEVSGRDRGREIGAWLESDAGRDVEAFAIVDDDAAAGTGFGERFVQTRFEEGLTLEHARRIVQLLLEASKSSLPGDH